MVEIFKTNIASSKEAKVIQDRLSLLLPGFEINFDLYDVERILRIKSNYGPIDPFKIMKYLRDMGYAVKIAE